MVLGRLGGLGLPVGGRPWLQGQHLGLHRAGRFSLGLRSQRGTCVVALVPWSRLMLGPPSVTPIVVPRVVSWRLPHILSLPVPVFDRRGCALAARGVGRCVPSWQVRGAAAWPCGRRSVWGVRFLCMWACEAGAPGVGLCGWSARAKAGTGCPVESWCSWPCPSSRVSFGEQATQIGSQLTREESVVCSLLRWAQPTVQRYWFEKPEPGRPVPRPGLGARPVPCGCLRGPGPVFPWTP